jgi:precorrin-3B synthase
VDLSAAIAGDHGGEVHLAARGALGIRDLRDEEELLRRAAGHGLFPDATHDRARDIIASPLAGRLPGHGDLGDLPGQLATALRVNQDGSGLNDRFLFGLDDGSGDVLAHSPDLAAVAGGPGGVLRLVVAGRDTTVSVPVADAASVMASAAAEFTRCAEGASRIPPSGRLHDLVVVHLTAHPLTSTHDDGAPATMAVEVPPVGWIDTSDGLVSLLAVVPHGVVPARLAEFLGAVERPSTVSADGVIGLHGLTEGMAEQVVRVLAPMGMVFDAASPWVGGG